MENLNEWLQPGETLIEKPARKVSKSAYHDRQMVVVSREMYGRSTDVVLRFYMERVPHRNNRVEVQLETEAYARILIGHDRFTYRPCTFRNMRKYEVYEYQVTEN